jgi:hypothetical protein
MSRTEWSPEGDLAALLDALTDEVLAAPDRDVWLAVRDVGEDPADAVREMRRLLASAEHDPPVSVGAGFAAGSPGTIASRVQ